MGSKNLKAVAVKGSGSITVADKEAFRNKVCFLCPIGCVMVIKVKKRNMNA